MRYYAEIGDGNFKCALFNQQLVYKMRVSLLANDENAKKTLCTSLIICVMDLLYRYLGIDWPSYCCFFLQICTDPYILFWESY